MDKIDAKILNLMQEGLPLCSRPFLIIAELLGITEEECMNRLQRLLDSGIVRRLGGVFDSQKMGMSSTLCALRVPDDAIDEVASVINSYREVTHNYLRNNEQYNMWFTITAFQRSSLNRIIDEIEEKTGLRATSMPVRKAFKIKVVFKLDG